MSAHPAATAPSAAQAAEVELAIGGMTCASCAARIEKKLNRMDGVEATVNYATEKAKVTFTDGVAVADLIATVEATGYTARGRPGPSGKRRRKRSRTRRPTRSRRSGSDWSPPSHSPCPSWRWR